MLDLSAVLYSGAPSLTRVVVTHQKDLCGENRNEPSSVTNQGTAHLPLIFMAWRGITRVGFIGFLLEATRSDLAFVFSLVTIRSVTLALEKETEPRCV